MRVKAAVEGKTKDVNLLDVTPENFIVPKGEEHFYHCRIEIKKFDSETGERLSTPRMQVFGKKFFETFGLHNLRKQGYTVDVMHNPNDWEAENREKIAARAREKQESEAKAAEELKKAEKEAIKAEVIAELKAAGIIPDEAKKPGRKKKAETEEAGVDEAPENNE